MHLNTRSTIVLLLLAFSVSAFGCVESTEQTDELATIPQEIVLFSAQPSIDGPAFSYGFSKTDGWQFLRYADLQTATDFGDSLQARQLEMNFSGSTTGSGGRFSGSLADPSPSSTPNFSMSFSGGTQAFHNFQANIAGGSGLSCSIYLICDFVDAICDAFQGQAGVGIGECRQGAAQCRSAVSQTVGSLSPKDEAAFCAVFDAIISGNFSGVFN